MDNLKNVTIPGDKIYLRDLQIDDVTDNYVLWMNDLGIVRFTESRFNQYSKEAIRKYVKSQNEDNNTLFLAIVRKEDERHIGNIKLGPINWFHRLSSIGILIGDKFCWNKGYGTEAVQLLSEYAFGKLNLHKITAGCIDKNAGSIKAFQKAGFSIECIRKKHNFFESSYHDVVVLCMLNKDIG